MRGQSQALSEVKAQIEVALSRATAEQEDPGAYGFLFAIFKILRQMLRSLGSDRIVRARIAGGLGRLVTDTYSFSESELGQELLRVADSFAELGGPPRRR